MLAIRFWNLTVFAALFAINNSQQQEVGDSCEAIGKQGVCKLYSECQVAKDDLINRRIYPKTCGFKQSEPIVCCAEEKITKQKKKREPGEISKKKCEEFSQYVYSKYISPVALLNPPVFKKNECGHSVVKLIIGGEITSRREFPHMAAIAFEEVFGGTGFKCGGTIISERYVLTAAHCLNHHVYGNATFVRVGITRLTNTDQSQSLEVEELIFHPNYHFPAYYNDIGLIKLKEAIKLNSYARPACLYTKSEISTKKAIATGWGDTTIEGQSSANDLMKVILHLVNHDNCNFTYRFHISRKLTQGILDDIQICADGGDAIRDTCLGDSGGPLQIYHKGDNIYCMYDIVGVTSFGEPCSGSAGVYVRVSKFIQWIEDIVWPENK